MQDFLSAMTLHASPTPDGIFRTTYAGTTVTARFLSGMVFSFAQKFPRLLEEQGTIALERMTGIEPIMTSSVRMLMHGCADYGAK